MDLVSPCARACQLSLSLLLEFPLKLGGCVNEGLQPRVVLQCLVLYIIWRHEPGGRLKSHRAVLMLYQALFPLGFMPAAYTDFFRMLDKL